MGEGINDYEDVDMNKTEMHPKHVHICLRGWSKISKQYLHSSSKHT